LTPFDTIASNEVKTQNHSKKRRRSKHSKGRGAVLAMTEVKSMGQDQVKVVEILQIGGNIGLF